MNFSELTPIERAAVVAFELRGGREATAVELAELCNVTPSGARRMLHKMSRVIPLQCEGGIWRVIQRGGDDGE